MKKRITAIVLTVLLCVGTLGVLAACTNSGNASPLKMEKKYIAEETINSTLTEQEMLDKNKFYTCERYYIFHSDGTGEYLYNAIDYLTGKRRHAKYTIHFKYTYLDGEKSAVACFFDSIDNQSYVLDSKEPDIGENTDWSQLLTVSENVLTTTGGVFFVNEDYAKELTNFNK